MHDIGPGSIIRSKSIVDCRGIEPGEKPKAELTYKRSQAKKAVGKYFVLLLLGIDDGNELNPEETLERMGWKFVGENASSTKKDDLLKRALSLIESNACDHEGTGTERLGTSRLRCMDCGVDWYEPDGPPENSFVRFLKKEGLR